MRCAAAPPVGACALAERLRHAPGKAFTHTQITVLPPATRRGRNQGGVIGDPIMFAEQRIPGVDFALPLLPWVNTGYCASDIFMSSATNSVCARPAGTTDRLHCWVSWLTLGVQLWRCGWPAGMRPRHSPHVTPPPGMHPTHPSSHAPISPFDHARPHPRPGLFVSCRATITTA